MSERRWCDICLNCMSDNDLAKVKYNRLRYNVQETFIPERVQRIYLIDYNPELQKYDLIDKEANVKSDSIRWTQDFAFSLNWAEEYILGGEHISQLQQVGSE